VPGGNGNVQHNDIIGKPLSMLRLDGRDNRYVAIQYPTLEQYVSLTRRNVTPIYATYANTIVSLLDLHAILPTTQPAQDGSVKPIEILEAGTGHGSLTIHLARAIAAGNTTQPSSTLPRGRQTSTKQMNLSAEDEDADTNSEWSVWFKSRQAVIHTVEKVKQNSIDAERLIRGFRQGIYWPHIDFYADDVDAWLESQLEQRKVRSTGFLSHAILDLPGVEQMVPVVAEALREEAKLMVFCPSITQIAECQKMIHQNKTPLVFEKAVELGEGISSGRVWDVRVVLPRKTLVAKEPVMQIEEPEVAADSASDESISSEVGSPAASLTTNMSEDLKFVCRPKVGEMTFGGGFLGLWRKSTFRRKDQ
jgi:tRNA A58 N-methylase Trm61